MRNLGWRARTRRKSRARGSKSTAAVCEVLRLSQLEKHAFLMNSRVGWIRKWVKIVLFVISHRLQHWHWSWRVERERKARLARWSNWVSVDSANKSRAAERKLLLFCRNKKKIVTYRWPAEKVERSTRKTSTGMRLKTPKWESKKRGTHVVVCVAAKLKILRLVDNRSRLVIAWRFRESWNKTLLAHK